MPDAGLIYLVPHFRCDPVGPEDQRTCTAQALDLVGRYLDAARRDPCFKFILSGLDCLKPYWDVFPEQRAFLRELVAARRLEIVGGYNEPSETSINGEARLRNLTYGRIFQRGILGADSPVYLALRGLGDCPQLPQMLRQLGCTACVFSTDAAGGKPLCRALALDGSDLIRKHARCRSYPATWSELSDQIGAQGEVDRVQSDTKGLGIDLDFIGGDLQPPPEWLLGRTEELAAHAPALQMGLPGEYLEALEQRLGAGPVSLSVSSRGAVMDDSGATVSRIELKIANRLAENALFAAERFCSIAWLLGAEYPHRALDKTWRLLMFGQHHDAITGALCDVSFLDLMTMYRESLAIARQVEAEVLEALAGVVDAAPLRGEALSAVVVFNPLPWSRTEVCRVRLTFDPPAGGFGLRDAARKDIPCQLLGMRGGDDGIVEAEVALLASDVPALGYAVYHVVADARPPQAGELREADRGVIENEFYTVTAAAQPGGGLISILDRQAKRQVLDLSRGHPGNEIAVLREQPDRRQPARMVVTTGEQVFSKDDPARVWVERGPLRERIIVQGSGPDCGSRSQEIALYPGVRRIDFAVALHRYRGEHQFFAATFPLALAGCVPVFDEGFGAVARHRSAGCLDHPAPGDSPRPIPGCALLPAQNWMELGNCLRITARRAKSRPEVAFSVGHAAIITGGEAESRRAGERLMRILAARGIICDAYVGGENIEADRTRTSFRFYVSLADPNVLESDRSDPRSPLAQEVRRRGYALRLTLEPPGEDGRRMPALLLVARDAASAAAALAELEKDAADGIISLPAASNAVDESPPAPDDYGVGLLNQGNIGASVEADGTAVLALMHTAAWPDLPWGQGKLTPFFVPEHKDHHFRYALYPHRGDWREAGTARRAYEFNQPLAALSCAAVKGPLPSRQSFFSLDPSNLYLAALKPPGFPLAMGDRRESAAEDSVVVRVYEGHGEAAGAQLTASFPISAAWRCDAGERRGEQLRSAPGPVTFDVAPYKIETLELAVKRQGVLTGRHFGASIEPVQPLHAHYWEHNLGPAPMGNQPITVTMRGSPPIGATTRFSLTVGTTRRDAEAAGVVRLSVPAAWTVTPQQVPFRLAPGGEQEYEVAVIIPPDARPGLIRAECEFDEQVYQTVLPVGEIQPVTASVLRVGGKIEVSLRNPNADSVQGRVDIITPLETWGAVVGDYARIEVTPAAQGFNLAPGAETTLSFEVLPVNRLPVSPPSAEPDFWVYARIACHGQVQYVQAKS